MNKPKQSKGPRERDFTAGLVNGASCSYVGTTGEVSLDQRIMAMAQDIAGDQDACLLAEMMTTAVRITRGPISGGDYKMMNRALKEMQIAHEIFASFRGGRKVAVFGSARTPADDPEYLTAVDFSKRMLAEGFMTITGAGPGIMAAGNEGAGRENSFGLNISLPFEASANAFIAGNEKLIDFNFFFTRKLSFVKEADAAVAFPGGFGTMDEIFEALTLIQTGKATVYPIVLIDAKGGNYWKDWEEFVKTQLLSNKLISETDFALFKVTDCVDEAIEEIVSFYKVFHSYRYVGDQLVIRLNEAISENSLAALNKDFADIVKSGEIVQRGALEEEANEEDLAELPRVVLRHKRRDFGRLRMLIDAINESK